MSFRLKLVASNPCLAHLHTFFDCNIFSVHITRFSINFTWFILLTRENSNERTLHRPGAFCLIFRYFQEPQNKCFSEIKIIWALNPLQTIQSFHLTKIYCAFISKKKILLFIELVPLKFKGLDVLGYHDFSHHLVMQFKLKGFHVYIYIYIYIYIYMKNA